ncbi:RraA family protein [bacterium]|nr:RraA family protein [bacterium]
MDTNVEKDYEEYEKLGRIWGNVPKEYIKQIKIPRVDKSIIDQFLEFEDLTSTVSDVLDTLGLQTTIPASYLPPIITGRKVVGPAVTIRNIAEKKTPTQGYIDRDFIRMASRELFYLAEPGDIAVSDFGGNPEVSNMGGVAMLLAKVRGVAGAVVNGAIRDVGTALEIDFPVWCRGKTPISGKFRLAAIEINGPVTLYNVVVVPGDLIIADDSGVCIVPYDKVDLVLKEVKMIQESEAKMIDMVRRNAPISEQKLHFRKRYK